MRGKQLECTVDQRKLVEDGVQQMLDALGFKGEDFSMTPERFTKALLELCSGLTIDLDEAVWKDGIFEIQEKQRRVPTKFKNIDGRGLCPHHLYPIIYTAEISYSPKKHVVGLSRVHRLVEVLAARPVLQEQLVVDIADTLGEKLKCPVKVTLEGIHMCMCARGSRTSLHSPVICEVEVDYSDPQEIPVFQPEIVG